jgi:hypothetical protein
LRGIQGSWRGAMEVEIEHGMDYKTVRYEARRQPLKTPC